MRKIFTYLIIILLGIGISGCSSLPFNNHMYTLDINKKGEGTIFKPNGQGEYEFEENTIVNISLDPAEGHSFSHWKGEDQYDVIAKNYPLEWEINMDENKSITAVFYEKSYSLNITTYGSGNVKEKIVTSTQDYDHGTIVQLTANSNDGWYFDQWEGDITGSENPKQIEVDSEKHITASFSQAATVSGEVDIKNSTNYYFDTSSNKKTTKTETYNTSTTSSYKKNEIIIKYKSMVSAQSVKNLENNNSLTKKNQIKMGGDIALYKIPKDKKVSKMIEKFKRKENVEWVEPNYIYKAMEVPDDPDYDKQWGNRKINLEAAWDIEKGSDSVKVAVVDSGIIPSHPDLQDNLLQGADFVDGSDRSNSDDPSNYDPTDNDPTDETTESNGGSHGTHVAGIIGAVVNNSKGIAGVNWNIDILPVRVLGDDGIGTAWDIAEGIYYSVDQYADIINLSLGGYNESNLYEEALNYASNNGVIVFAASGNDGYSQIAYPARYDSTIAVGSINSNYERSSFSNYGSNLDLVASGGINSNGNGIYSTWGYYDSNTDTTEWGYRYMSGTSMATPYASGVAALLISNGVTGVDNIKNRMTSTAVDLGSSGKDDYFGHGLVDAYGALLNKELDDPYIFAGKESDGSIEFVSEIIYSDRGNYQLNNVEPGNIKIYGWRDTNDNSELDAGDYWGETDLFHVGESNDYNKNVNIYYVTESNSTSLNIKEIKDYQIEK